MRNCRILAHPIIVPHSSDKWCVSAKAPGLISNTTRDGTPPPGASPTSLLCGSCWLVGSACTQQKLVRTSAPLVVPPMLVGQPNQCEPPGTLQFQPARNRIHNSGFLKYIFPVISCTPGSERRYLWTANENDVKLTTMAEKALTPKLRKVNSDCVSATC